MKSVFQAVLLLIIFILIGCEEGKKLFVSSDEEEIRNNFKNWVKVSEQGDVDGYFNHISNDFVYIGTPDNKPIVDHDSLRLFLSTFFSNNTFSLPEWETHEVLIRGNLAIHRLSGIVYSWPKNDTTNVHKEDRTYLDIYRKNENGKWKVYLHSYEINDKTTTNKK